MGIRQNIKKIRDRTCNLKKRIQTQMTKAQGIGKEIKLFSRRPKEKPTR